MKTIKESARKIPVLRECDVLVVGGGPAGISAAIGAARMGKDTVVVERYGCLGGILTTCSMETPAWWRDEAAVMPGGIFQELDDRMVKAGLAQHTFFRPSTGTAYDTEALKYVCDDLIAESGAASILHCIGVSPLMEGDKIKGVVTESKSGRMAILAGRVIDCTGDGDIAARAGAPYLTADEDFNGGLPKGQPLGGTLCYGLSDVNTAVLEAFIDEDPTCRHPITHKLCYQGFRHAIEDGIPLPDGLRIPFVYNMVEENALPALNHAWTPVDGTDVMSLTRAEITCRKGILEGIEIMRKYYTGMENAKLRNYSMGLGVRETRRIDGAYMLTLRDIFEDRCFDDSIGVYPFCSDGAEGTIPASTAHHFEAPFGITVPKQVENLLVAGRCVSAKRRCTGISRMVNFAMLTGQATGVASAVSIDGGTTSREADIPTVQKELEKQGVRIHSA